MRRTDGLFTRRERRIAILAAVLVIVITALALITGGLFHPSTGTRGAGGYGFADLPGVADARPLG